MAHRIKSTVHETGHIGNVAAERKRRAVRALNKVSAEIHRHIVKSTRGKGAGRVYGKHQASLPGEPPAKDTGDLNVSIKFNPAKEEDKKPIAVVGTDSDHASHMEFGTRTVEARPFLRPAFDLYLPKIREAVKKALSKR